ncbi:MAG: TRCF domain-containing protein [Actinomycetota bacterium]
MRLLAEAVDEAKGRTPEPKHEVKIDLPVDAHLPESWISKEPLRLEAYRRIAEAPTLEALDDARKELTDRFGPLPPQAETLLTVAALRFEIGPRGVRTVTHQNGRIRLEPFVLLESEQVRVRYRFPGSIFKPQTYTVVLPVPRDVQNVAAWLLDAARDILSP